MADFRCANPEYQLDVDVMMLEYTLYYAIDTKLKALKAHALEVKTEEEEDLDSYMLEHWATEQDFSADADKLVESFDTLIRLFRHHHPTQSLSEGTNFNVKVLELLVLSGQWLNQEPAVDKLKQERPFNSRYRRHWLKQWISDPHSGGNVLGRHIFPDMPGRLDFSADQIELNDCLVRFMDISAEIGDAMGCVNEQWYHLASEFMLQSAADRMCIIPDNVNFHPDRPLEATTHIVECFAWGLIQPHPSDTMRNEAADLDDRQQRRLDDQTYISNVFHTRDSQSNGNSNGETKDTGPKKDDNTGDVEMSNSSQPPPIEDPTWTHLRTESLAEFLNNIDTHTTTNDPPSKHAVATRIRRAHPLPGFLTRLYRFIEDAWCLNVETISEKPTLVQIEEGGLKGCDQKEFRQFLDRVGLKVSGRGVVKWVR